MSSALDAPPRDGRVARAVLAALDTPATPAEVAGRLGWPCDHARCWVGILYRQGRLIRLDWTTGARGQRAGRYQRSEVPA